MTFANKRSAVGGAQPQPVSGDLDTAGRWRYQHYFAGLAVLFVVYQSFGWVGWIADGPVQITKYRDKTDPSWYLAWVWQGLSLITLVVVLTWVIRKARRERRFVVEAQFCIAGLLCYWQDPVSNFVQPLFFNSSNWVNLNEWTGNLPFVVNPDAGRMPEPVLFGLPLYISGFLAFAKILSYLVGRVQSRFPTWGTAQLVLVAIMGGMLIDVLLEVPIYLTGLWAYPGQPDIGVLAASGHKYPITEALAGGVFFGVLMSMIFFKDDRGRTLMERGLEGRPTRRQVLVTQLALVGVFNLTYFACNIWWIGMGLHSGSYKPMEAHTVAGLCDAPGISGTSYGACPGSPGYRLPLPGTLTCPKPGGDPIALNLTGTCKGGTVVKVDRTKAHF